MPWVKAARRISVYLNHPPAPAASRPAAVSAMSAPGRPARDAAAASSASPPGSRWPARPRRGGGASEACARAPRRSLAAAEAPDVDDLRARAGGGDELVGHEDVAQDEVGGAQAVGGAQGEQFRVAWAGSDKADMAQLRRAGDHRGGGGAVSVTGPSPGGARTRSDGGASVDAPQWLRSRECEPGRDRSLGRRFQARAETSQCRHARPWGRGQT